MLQVIRDLKIVIFSHYCATGACEELRDWLNSGGAREVVYVAFPFGSNPDRFIRVDCYAEGRHVRQVRSLFRLKLPEPLAYAKDFVYAVWYAWRFGRKADVLVAGDNLLALAASLVKWCSGIKRVVYYMIDYTPVRYANRLLNRIYCWIDRLAATRATQVWPLTEEMIRARFEAGQLDERNVRYQVVPYGCTPTEGVAFDRKQVVYMGGIAKQKGAELFVPFALELKKRVPDFSFVIIGDGKDVPALREDVQRAGLQEHVTIHGFVEAMQDVLVLLAKAGVAIAPYYPHDTNSFTFYADPDKIKTYLGCGLPIVLTAVPPIAKTLASAHVGKIASYDAADFAEKVAEIMNTPEYNTLRVRVQDFGKRFDWNTVFETALANIDLYREGEP